MAIGSASDLVESATQPAGEPEPQSLLFLENVTCYTKVAKRVMLSFFFAKNGHLMANA